MKKAAEISGWRFGFSFALCMALLTVAGCSSSPTERGPSSVRSQLTMSGDLKSSIRKFHEWVRSEQLNRATCAPVLNEAYQEIYRLSPSQFDLNALSRDWREVIQEIFLTRLDLRKKLGEMSAQGAVDSECVNAVRNVLRAGRYVEEFIADWKGQTGAPTEVYTGDFPAMMRNPAYPNFELRSGDILMSRGMAFTSAAIARIGDIDGQFSHIAVVYIDENKKVWTIEAHIEIGSKVFPLEEYLRDGKGRSVVFRLPDAALAHQAAKHIYERTLKASQGGENIPYDFGMDLSNSNEIFCSEVAYVGYQQASNGAYILPMFRTSITMKQRKFLDAIGVKVTSTFAPSDMDVDPRFEVVAEWRDIGKVRDIRLKDAVLTSIFGWMESKNYIFKPSPAHQLKKYFAYSLRHLPFLEKTVAEKFPTNMSITTLGVLFALDKVSGYMQDELAKVNNDQHQRNGFWMTPMQMGEVLEKIRLDDVARTEAWLDWRRWESSHHDDPRPSPEFPKFHWEFGPEGQHI